MVDLKKIQKNSNGISITPLAVAVTGAVVGIGLAVAGAVVLSDEKNREKVKTVLADAKKTTQGYVADIQHRAKDKKNEIEKKGSKLVSVVEEAVKEVEKI
ncbi:MAG: hypothetical protein WCO78_01310 [Candidatus Roizmanbacteria bacterium]